MIACLHAYRFTHFDNSSHSKTSEAEMSSFGQKVKALVLGIDNPRPVNIVVPKKTFETIRLKSNKEIECWWIKKDSAKGSVILFHGYGGSKSTLLDKANVFYELGYNTLLVDFMGSGGSEGNQTTIGFYEAMQVKTAFDYIVKRGENNIILFGTSLGAAAVMKAMADYNCNVSSIILECPFGTMIETVKARFATMKIPSFPMANLLVFWGGTINGFNAFSHNPVKYATHIRTPTLLLYGEKDKKVSRGEIDRIFSNLGGKKFLKTYALAGHENYLNKYAKEWKDDIRYFLTQK
jgi:alpha-beta hydrolase superfamily lysophospholipase